MSVLYLNNLNVKGLFICFKNVLCLSFNNVIHIYIVFSKKPFRNKIIF